MLTFILATVLTVVPPAGDAAALPAKTPAPAITAVDPQVTWAGTKLAIRGSHLSGVTQVWFEPKCPARFKAISDQELEVTVPDGATESGRITVVAPAGRAESPETVAVVPGGTGGN
jgi:hypothetical protein